MREISNLGQCLVLQTWLVLHCDVLFLWQKDQFAMTHTQLIISFTSLIDFSVFDSSFFFFSVAIATFAKSRRRRRRRRHTWVCEPKLRWWPKRHIHHVAGGSSLKTHVCSIVANQIDDTSCSLSTLILEACYTIQMVTFDSSRVIIMAQDSQLVDDLEEQIITLFVCFCLAIIIIIIMKMKLIIIIIINEHNTTQHNKQTNKQWIKRKETNKQTRLATWNWPHSCSRSKT